MGARRRLALALRGVLLRPGAALAGERWTVTVRGRDLSRDAEPSERGRVLFVDAGGLAGALGLTVRVAAGGRVEIRDPSGSLWYAVAGSGELQTSGRALTLDGGWQLVGASARLPLSALTALAGMELAIDRARRVARIEPPPAAQVVGSLAGGWQLLTVPKPAGAGATAPGDPPAPAAAEPHLPAARQSLQVGFGLGWVQGADFGGELSASGSVAGLDTQLFGLASWGAEGARLDHGALTVGDPVAGWSLAAGELFSEVWGTTPGLRLGLERSRWHRPALSLYLADEPRGRSAPVLAFRDHFELGEHGTLAFEASSDRSYLVRSRFELGRWGASGYLRDGSPGGPEDGFGGALSFALVGAARLEASYTRAGGEQELVTWSGALRLPLGSQSGIDVETSVIESAGSRNQLQAVAGRLPVGPLRLRARLQRSRSEALLGGHPAQRLRREQLGLLAGVGYARPGVQVELQLARFAASDGSVSGSAQVLSSWILSRDTTVEWVGSFDGGFALDDSRLRLRHVLGRGLEVSVEYGRVGAYQTLTDLLQAAELPGERFRVMLRARWDVATPAGGSRVHGTVREPAGVPQPGLPIRLGEYRTFSDARGRYQFAHVPGGAYTVRVDEEHLPASYAGGSPASTVETRGRGAREANLTVVPLGRVRGRVVSESPGDGAAVAGLVVWLDDRATRTTADGSFAFANVAPGVHELRLDSTRLPAQLTAGLPAQMQIGLPPGQSLEGVELKVRRLTMPIVLRELAK